MRQITWAMLLVGTTFCATQAARAAEDYNNPHTLDKVSIVGSKSVPTDQLTPALQEQPGSKVTQDGILADRDAIMKVLESKNVGGSVGIRIIPKTNHHISVEFVVQDQGIKAPVVTKVNARLHQETFDGNVSIPSDKLAAAVGLNPGDEVTNAKMSAGQAALVNLYKTTKMKAPTNISVSADTRILPGAQVDVMWHIKETKTKAKPLSREEQEQQDQIQ